MGQGLFFNCCKVVPSSLILYATNTTLSITSIIIMIVTAPIHARGVGTGVERYGRGGHGRYASAAAIFYSVGTHVCSLVVIRFQRRRDRDIVSFAFVDCSCESDGWRRLEGCW